MQGGGESRAKAKASNYAYTYLRAYAGIAFTSTSYNTPCTTPYKMVNNYLLEAPNTIMNVEICYPVNSPQLRLITSKVSTGNPSLEVTHAIYVGQ